LNKKEDKMTRIYSLKTKNVPMPVLEYFFQKFCLGNNDCWNMDFYWYRMSDGTKTYSAYVSKNGRGWDNSVHLQLKDKFNVIDIQKEE